MRNLKLKRSHYPTSVALNARCLVSIKFWAENKTRIGEWPRSPATRLEHFLRRPNWYPVTRFQDLVISSIDGICGCRRRCQLSADQLLGIYHCSLVFHGWLTGGGAGAVFFFHHQPFRRFSYKLCPVRACFRIAAPTDKTLTCGKYLMDLD